MRFTILANHHALYFANYVTAGTDRFANFFARITVNFLAFVRTFLTHSAGYGNRSKQSNAGHNTFWFCHFFTNVFCFLANIFAVFSNFLAFFIANLFRLLTNIFANLFGWCTDLLTPSAKLFGGIYGRSEKNQSTHSQYKGKQRFHTDSPSKIEKGSVEDLRSVLPRESRKQAVFRRQKTQVIERNVSTTSRP